MLWEEEKKPKKDELPDYVVEILFSLECRELPVEHISALSNALVNAAPWLKDEPTAGIHPIHLAGSQNGWERPSADAEQQLMLSKRTKLTLRIPRSRIDDAETLVGITLDIDGYPLTLGKFKIKPLSKLTTIFCRHITTSEEEEEITFLERISDILLAKNIRLTKALPGMLTSIKTKQGNLASRSLLIANITKEESLIIQHEGIGDQQLLGCGLFIPHKGIEAVKDIQDDS